MNLKEIISLLNTKNTEELFNKAYQTKIKEVGKFIYLRALIELSNICQKNCYYCGLRKDNLQLSRYLLPEKEVKNIIDSLNRKNFASFLIQAGERQDKIFIEYISQIIEYAQKISNGNFAIVLSLGEQKKEVYKKWFELGASRYLLRIETSNANLYKKIHPSDHSFSKRLQALQELKKIGYQLGTGIMVGFAGQTIEDIAKDILFFKNLNVDMLGLGPYIKSKNTPMENLLSKEKENFKLTLKVIAICRILLKDINITSSTALQAIDKKGYLKGLLAGANVIMPNFTPTNYKENYSIYEKKNIVKDEVFAYNKILSEEIVYKEKGDPKHYLKRKK